MNAYTPRRCSKRWLDGDCPPEVLAIIRHPHTDGGTYDVIYTDVQTVQYEHSHRVEQWLEGFSIAVSGAGIEHFELQAHQVAAYRYRFKHRYAKWSTLPDAVKDAVRRDIADAKKWTEENA